MWQPPGRNQLLPKAIGWEDWAHDLRAMPLKWVKNGLMRRWLPAKTGAELTLPISGRWNLHPQVHVSKLLIQV